MEEQTQNQNLQEETASEEKPSKDVSFPRRKDKKGSKRGLKIIVVVIILIIIGVVYYLLIEPKVEKEISVTPTPQSEVTLTPTMAVEDVEKDEVKINILNGTGLPGAAGSLRDKLEVLGYSDIDVGNASEQDYESTQVTFNRNVADTTVDEIVGKLNEVYEDVEVSTSTLDEVEIEIITGYPSGHTPTVTEAPESTTTPTTGVTGTATPTSTTTPTP